MRSSPNNIEEIGLLQLRDLAQEDKIMWQPSDDGAFFIGKAGCWTISISTNPDNGAAPHEVSFIDPKGVTHDLLLATSKSEALNVLFLQARRKVVIEPSYLISSTQPEYDVFLAYKRECVELARRVDYDLSCRGIRVWFDLRELNLRGPYCIEAALRAGFMRSKLVLQLFILASPSVENPAGGDDDSRWYMREVNLPRYRPLTFWEISSAMLEFDYEKEIEELSVKILDFVRGIDISDRSWYDEG